MGFSLSSNSFHQLQMSRIVRKLDSCLCENKGTDQLCSNCTADQRLCFRYSDRTISASFYSQNFQPLACFCGYTVRFVSDLVGNSEDRFSHITAQLISISNMSILKRSDSLLNIMSCTSLVERFGYEKLGREVRKTVFGSMDHVTHKPACATTEDG